MTKRNCLSADELTGYLGGLLGAAERGRAEEHLSLCRDCRKRLAAAHRSRAEAPVTAAPAELRRRARALAPRRRRPGRRRGWALAAVLLAGLGLSLLIFHERYPAAPDSEALRAGPSEPLSLLSPGAGETVDAGRSTPFRWRRVPEARRYTLSVVDALGDLVHRATVSEPDAEVTPGVFEAGREYFWYVTVVLEDGGSLESGVRSFTTGAGS